MSASRCVAKLTGADVELGNFVDGAVDHGQSVREASRALLLEIRAQAGVDGECAIDDKTENQQDCGRTFLSTNGGCAYIDLDHLELCIPEVLSAFDHVASWHAMLRIASSALASVNDRRPGIERVRLLANNSDGRVSYGSHLNVLVSRTAWDEIVHRKPHYLAFLAAFQVSSLPFTGQGKVGSEHGAAPVAYQLSQRADYFETMAGVQTTCMRPLVNTRDEPLCGRWHASRGHQARLHSIFFDSTLCHVSTVLRVGTMQLVLAMIEAGEVDTRCALDDPLVAVRRWSANPTLDARAPLVGGERVTALELQRRFLEQATRFVDSGYAEGLVPRASEILALWDATLTLLEARDWDALSHRLDWVLKLSFLERALEYRPDLTFASPEIKHLDHLYSSLDHADGLFWSMADRGLVETVVSADDIERSVILPPGDTRAWGRASLQKRAGAALEEVDWDFVRVRLHDRHGDADVWRVDLPDPLGSTQSDVRHVLEGSEARRESLAELLQAIGATREPRVVQSHKPAAGAALDYTHVLGPWRHGGTRVARAAWSTDSQAGSQSGGADGTA